MDTEVQTCTEQLMQPTSLTRRALSATATVLAVSLAVAELATIDGIDIVRVEGPRELPDRSERAHRRRGRRPIVTTDLNSSIDPDQWTAAWRTSYVIDRSGVVSGALADLQTVVHPDATNQGASAEPPANLDRGPNPADGE
jgi:hypothetical protein